MNEYLTRTPIPEEISERVSKVTTVDISGRISERISGKLTKGIHGRLLKKTLEECLKKLKNFSKNL